MPDDDDTRLQRLQDELRNRVQHVDAKVVQDYVEKQNREVEALKSRGDVAAALAAAEAVRVRLVQYQQQPQATDPLVQAAAEIRRAHGPQRVALEVMLERAREARQQAGPLAHTDAERELSRALELSRAARAGDERQQRQLEELALQRAHFGFDRLELSVTARTAGV